MAVAGVVKGSKAEEGERERERVAVVEWRPRMCCVRDDRRRERLWCYRAWEKSEL